MKQQINFRASEHTSNQLAELESKTGLNQTEVIAIAIDRMYQKEIEMPTKQIVLGSRNDADGEYPSLLPGKTVFTKDGEVYTGTYAFPARVILTPLTQEEAEYLEKRGALPKK